jgi:hypothetical protein
LPGRVFLKSAPTQALTAEIAENAEFLKGFSAIFAVSAVKGFSGHDFKKALHCQAGFS